MQRAIHDYHDLIRGERARLRIGRFGDWAGERWDWEPARFGHSQLVFFCDAVDAAAAIDGIAEGFTAHTYWDDLMRAYDDLADATAAAWLYYPHLKSPRDIVPPPDAPPCADYVVEGEADGYCMRHLGQAHEAAYKLVDRYAVLLYTANEAFFDFDRGANVTFDKVIRKVRTLPGESPEWLAAFRDVPFARVNAHRRREVHRFSARTTAHHAAVRAGARRDIRMARAWATDRTAIIMNATAFCHLAEDLFYHACRTAKQLATSSQ